MLRAILYYINIIRRLTQSFLLSRSNRPHAAALQKTETAAAQRPARSSSATATAQPRHTSLRHTPLAQASTSSLDGYSGTEHLRDFKGFNSLHSLISLFFSFLCFVDCGFCSTLIIVIVQCSLCFHFDLSSVLKNENTY